MKSLAALNGKKMRKALGANSRANVRRQYKQAKMKKGLQKQFDDMQPLGESVIAEARRKIKESWKENKKW